MTHLLPAPLPANLILSAENKAGFFGVSVTKHVFCIVQSAAGKPFGSGEFMDIIYCLFIRGIAENIQIFKQQIPELLRLLYRPGIQSLIILKICALLLVYHLHESVNISVFSVCLGRLPQ